MWSWKREAMNYRNAVIRLKTKKKHAERNVEWKGEEEDRMECTKNGKYRIRRRMGMGTRREGRRKRRRRRKMEKQGVKNKLERKKMMKNREKSANNFS